MKHLRILLLLLMIPVVVQSQDKGNQESSFSLIDKLKLEKANELYDRLAFSHALGLYEELAVSIYKTHIVYTRLGDCYYNLGNTEKAELWYGKALVTDSIDPVYYYKYSQVLRSNGQYKESEIWMKKFADFNSEDSRIHSFEENGKNIDALTNRKKTFTVNEMSSLNSPYADFGAVKFNDQVVFASGRTENLMVNTRYAWNDKPFLDLYVFNPVMVPSGETGIFSKTLNSKFHEGPVCFTNDYKTIYFTRDNFYQGKRQYNKKGTTCLMILRADLVNGQWQNITSLPFNNQEYSVGHPSLSPDGRRLYFASDMPGSIGGTDIYYVDITGDNQYSSPVNLGTEINTEGNEMFPFSSPEGIYFSSDRIEGIGGLDIYFSKASDKNWTKAINLGSPVNSSKDDFSFTMNPEYRSGYFASNRSGGKGDDDIYSFTINNLVLKGIVRDTTYQDKPLENVGVKLLNTAGKQVEETKTGKNGAYEFYISFDEQYTVQAQQQGYVEKTRSISTIGVTASEISLNLNLGLDKPFMLIGVITDKKSGQKLGDVEITIIDTVKQTLILDTKTGVDGQISKELENVQMNSHLAFQVVLRKSGYLARTLVFDHHITDYETNMNNYMEVSLDKITLGSDIGKLLNINPIYFDLGKWDIRPDAAAELDKVVQAMKDNPTVTIELGSHTDSRGNSTSNLSLSDKRAKASADYIVSQGIEAVRIYGKGYGETRLINRCKDGVKCSEEEHAQNRRTEFKVVKL